MDATLGTAAPSDGLAAKTARDEIPTGSEDAIAKSFQENEASADKEIHHESVKRTQKTKRDDDIMNVRTKVCSLFHDTDFYRQTTAALSASEALREHIFHNPISFVTLCISPIGDRL